MGVLSGKLSAWRSDPLDVTDLLQRKSLRAYLFLRFELLDEYSEMRGDGRGAGVVLVLKALPNC